MGAIMSKGGGGRSATPILSSEANARIRKRTAEAWERDVNNMVTERSAYRYAWPFVLVMATALNIDLAVSYMIRTANIPADAAPFLWGYSWDEWKNGAIAFVLIVSARVLMVLISDDTTQGANATAGRVAARLVLVALIGYSIWTAAAETTTGLQETIDRSAAASTASSTAADNATTAQSVLKGAEQAAARARRDLQAAQAQDGARAQRLRADLEAAKWQVQVTRDDLSNYERDMKRQYANDGRSLGWALNATIGLAKPKHDAIRAAEAEVIAARDRLATTESAAVVAARNRLMDAETAVVSAGGAVIEAGKDKTTAAKNTGSEGTAIANMGASVPWWMGGPYTAAQMIVIQGLLVAILLEVVCFAGSGATGRLLRESINGHAEAMGDTAEVLRGQARAALGGGGGAAAAASGAPGGASIGAGAASSGGLWSRFAGGDPWKGRATPSGLDTGQGVDPAKAQADAVAKLRYADDVAAAVADAKGGYLEDCSFPYLRDVKGYTNAVATQIREALVAEGLAFHMPGNRVVMAKG